MILGDSRASTGLNSPRSFLTGSRTKDSPFRRSSPVQVLRWFLDSTSTTGKSLKNGSINFFQEFSVDGWEVLRELLSCEVPCPSRRRERDRASLQVLRAEAASRRSLDGFLRATERQLSRAFEPVGPHVGIRSGALPAGWLAN